MWLRQSGTVFRTVCHFSPVFPHKAWRILGMWGFKIYWGSSGLRNGAGGYGYRIREHLPAWGIEGSSLAATPVISSLSPGSVPCPPCAQMILSGASAYAAATPPRITPVKLCCLAASKDSQNENYFGAKAARNTLISAAYESRNYNFLYYNSVA